jgi:ATP-dependent DNA helicase RecQ
MPSYLPNQSLHELLHQVFGHREFRAHQQEVCEAAAAGRDVLLVMPTGAGKSLCYQLPALTRGGVGLVISPLIALMEDQAAKLESLGLGVGRVHSGRTRDDARQACRDYLAGTLDFLFIAPERLRVPGFPEMLAKRKPALIAIDEAHCISQWGHDFRPDYRMLGQHLQALRPTPVIAMTATATPNVQRDIVAQLDLGDAAIFITGFRRENLAVEAIELSKPQRAEFTAKLLAEQSARPAIVYAPSRKAAEELATLLNKKFPAKAYHAGLEAGVREGVQREFSSGKLEVVVATIAFGMGVDKSNVRTVVHVALPGSVEAYYQEIGRAGRDGLPARTVLLYSFADRKVQEFFLERSYPATGELERVARVLGDEFAEVDELARRLKMDREMLDRALEKLAAQGVAVFDMNGNVRMAEESALPKKWKQSYDAQVAFRRNQIDRMVAFAEGHTCRMQALVEHFGESDRRGACGHCDVCRPGSGENAHAPNANEREVLRAILKALEGRGQSTGKLFTELALTRERKEFDAWMDGLARAALISIANETFTNPEGKEITYRRATITHEGRTPDDATLATVWIRGMQESAKATKKQKKEAAPPVIRTRSVWSGGQRIMPDRGGHPASPLIAQKNRAMNGAAVHVANGPPEIGELNDIQSQLEARLKDWRKEQARAAGLPSFFIFSDTVLRSIALTRPKTVGELRNVRGVGPEKLDRFGAAVVELCRA